MTHPANYRAALAAALEVATLRLGVRGAGGTFHIHRESALAHRMVDVMLEELAGEGYEVRATGQVDDGA